MEFEMEMPEEFGGESNFLKEPGTYHCAVTQVLEGTGPKGGIIDGFTVGLDVLAGTTNGQEGKVINVTLFNPRLDQSENGKAMARRKQGAFLIAANVVNPATRGQRVTVDLQKAVGQQIVCKFAKDEREGGGDYLQLSYADIWHVDDPHCANVPKREDAIAMIPATLRHDAAWFEQLKSKAASGASGANGGKQQSRSTAQSAQAATKPDVNYDDL